MRFSRLAFILLALSFVFITLPNGQAQKNKSLNTTYDESLYNTVKWRLVGPFRGGRAGTAVGVLNNPNLYYMGTAGGGVWKTIDGGNSWSCISDGYFGGSIGAVAVSQSDPNVIYVGEGEQDCSRECIIWKRIVEIHRRRDHLDFHWLKGV